MLPAKQHYFSIQPYTHRCYVKCGKTAKNWFMLHSQFSLKKKHAVMQKKRREHKQNLCFCLFSFAFRWVYVLCCCRLSFLHKAHPVSLSVWHVWLSFELFYYLFAIKSSFRRKVTSCHELRMSKHFLIKDLKELCTVTNPTQTHTLCVYPIRGLSTSSCCVHSNKK